MNRKAWICLILAAIMVFSLAACGSKKTQAKTESAAQWTREGFFMDEQANILSITWMEDVDDPGWYVGCMLGEDVMEDSWGGTLPQEGNTLRGVLASSGSKDDLSVTVSEEGSDGILLSVEGGENYHFARMEQASIMVTVNTEGMGNIAYAEGETAPEIDPEYPYQSAQINLAEPATHTLVAWPQTGNVFIKWTKNGEDFSTDAQITVLLDESADYVAVFEADPDWQNPVMNYVGEYQCDRAHARVECMGNEEAWIIIEWAGSAWDLARWDIFGRLDPETRTITYTDCTKSILSFDDTGNVKSQEAEYEDGSGTIVFGEDGTFTWHEDQAQRETDLVFQWLPVSGVDLEPLDYADRDNWAYLSLGEDRAVDVFLICPTVDTISPENALELNESLKANFLYALDLEKGIYEETGRLFSPYYRQMSINAYELPEAERERAKEVAYRDVSEAFRWYLDNENNGRGIILAGFSQGSQMCQELLKEYYGGDDAESQSLRERLITVYSLGWLVTEEMTEAYPQIVPAVGETDLGTVISFDCEDGNVTDTLVRPAGVKALSINPLNWKTDGTPADKSLNRGAVFKAGGQAIPGLCGAYIGVHGELIVTDVSPNDYPPVLDVFPEGAYHLYDYMFFFTNLRENIAVRTEAWLAGQTEQAA
ncbi:MAG: DUF3089 domain-containing protein [Oscillospiraceae bacterium]|nr:DUF3089 domain-containing protein [Oscillospiraceae bacterium]